MLACELSVSSSNYELVRVGHGSVLDKNLAVANGIDAENEARNVNLSRLPFVIHLRPAAPVRSG